MAPAKQTQTSSPASDKKTTGQTEQQGAQEAEQQASAGALARQAQRVPRTLGARDLLSLQRAVGNRTVGRMLAPADRHPQDSSADQQDSNAQVQRHAEPVAAASPSIQRLAGLPQNTHVEVNDGGPLWYGEIVEVLNGSYRVRVGGMDKVVNVPEAQVTWHPSVLAVRASSLADQIIASAPAAPQSAEMDEPVGAWRLRKKLGQHPLDTLKLMKIGHQLSVNAQVQNLLQSAAGVAIVKEMFEELRRKTGRQFIQFWDKDPAEVVTERAYAWSVFRDGVAALRDNQAKLDIYFNECLDHDKGYGQTFGSTQSYIEIMDRPDQGSLETFEEALARALNTVVNTNIWVGGQQGGRISEQLVRGYDPGAVIRGWSERAQEENMWSQVVAKMINNNFNSIDVVKSKPQDIYDAVRALVPNAFALNIAYLNATFVAYDF